jgi:hypothetical protein
VICSCEHQSVWGNRGAESSALLQDAIYAVSLLGGGGGEGGVGTRHCEHEARGLWMYCLQQCRSSGATKTLNQLHC